MFLLLCSTIIFIKTRKIKSKGQSKSYSICRIILKLPVYIVINNTHIFSNQRTNCLLSINIIDLSLWDCSNRARRRCNMLPNSLKLNLAVRKIIDFIITGNSVIISTTIHPYMLFTILGKCSIRFLFFNKIKQKKYLYIFRKCQCDFHTLFYNIISNK